MGWSRNEEMWQGRRGEECRPVVTLCTIWIIVSLYWAAALPFTQPSVLFQYQGIRKDHKGPKAMSLGTKAK